MKHPQTCANRCACKGSLRVLLLSLAFITPLVAYGVSYTNTWELAPGIPQGQEVVVIATDNCALRQGTMILTIIPAKTVLTCSKTQGTLVEVSHNKQTGWIQISDCFPLGINPPCAEVWCRRALVDLGAGKLVEARKSLFIAAALEPEDPVYAETYEFCTTLQTGFAELRNRTQQIEQLQAEETSKRDSAEFIRNATGFGDATLRDQRMGSASRRHQEAQALADRIREAQADLEGFYQHLRVQITSQIEQLSKQGFQHIALALEDFVVNARTFKYAREASSHEVSEQVARSIARYQDAVAKFKEGKLEEGFKTLDESLRAWEQNKLPRLAENALRPKLDELRRKNERVNELIEKGSLVEATAMIKEVQSLSSEPAATEKNLSRARAQQANSLKTQARAEEALKEGRFQVALEAATEAIRTWGFNEEAKKIQVQAEQKLVRLKEVLATARRLEDDRKWREALGALEGVRGEYSSEPDFRTTETRLREEFKASEEALSKAQTLKEAGDLAGAYDLVKRYGQPDEAQRLGTALARKLDAEGKWAEGADIFRTLGCLEDARRLEAKIRDHEENGVLADPDWIAAHKSFEAKDFTEALQLMNAVARRFPNSSLVWAFMGTLHQRLNFRGKDVPFFKRALELNSENEEAWEGLGWAFFSAGQLAQAMDAFNICIQTHPKSYRAWIGLGVCQADLERFQDAYRAFQEALKIQPDDHFATSGIARCLIEKGDTKEGVQAYQKAIRLAPDDKTRAGYWNSLAECLRKKGFDKDAQKAEARAAKLSGGKP